MSIVDLRADSIAIKDQGNRGTCAACASTSFHEILRAEGELLSSEFLYWAAKHRDGFPNEEGTTITAIRQSLSEDGQPLELSWPYVPMKEMLPADHHPPTEVVTEAQQRLFSGGQNAQTLSSMMRSLISNRVLIVLALEIHSHWSNEITDGRIGLPTSRDVSCGGHAVMIVGYLGDEFIVQNSWGTEWGDGGYAYLPSAYIDKFGWEAWAAQMRDKH